MSPIRSMTNQRQAFFCPGCIGSHVLNTAPGAKPRWDYNGNPEAAKEYVAYFNATK